MSCATPVAAAFAAPAVDRWAPTTRGIDLFLRDVRVAAAGAATTDGKGTDVATPRVDRTRLLGTIKSIDDDFVVREIDSSGKIVVLDCFDSVPLPAAFAAPEHTESKADGAGAAEQLSGSKAAEVLEGTLGAQMFAAVQGYAEAVNRGAEPGNAAPVTLCLEAIGITTKEQRSVIHMGILHKWPFLCTTTSRLATPCQVCGTATPHVTVQVDAKYDAFRALLTSDELRAMQRYVTAGPQDLTARQGVILRSLVTKEQRTALHRALAVSFPFLSSATLTDGAGAGDKPVSIRFSGKALQVGHGPGPKRRRNDATQQTRFWLHFTLKSVGMEQLEACTRLAQTLRIPISHIAFAGNKDKKAVTYQRCAVPQLTAAELLRANGKMGKITVGNCEYATHALSLGDLYGNKFEIVLRDVKDQHGVVQTDFSSLKPIAAGLETHGFINYFGPQRVGEETKEPCSLDAGLAMIKGDWESVVNIILTPVSRDSAALIEAKTLWAKTRDPAAVLRVLPNRFRREQALLRGLNRFGPTEYFKAVQGVPRTVRILYAHAYQSAMWNRLASERLAHLGPRVVVGDLFVPGITGTGLHAARQRADALKADRVDIVTPDNVDRVSIDDVVLPVPGSGVKYPTNAMLDRIRASVLADGLSLAMFGLDDTVPVPSGVEFKGAYRFIIARPWDLSVWQYSADAIATPIYGDCSSLPDPPQQSQQPSCLHLQFCLPPSTFATMCLRELLHESPANGFGLREVEDVDAGDEEVGVVDDADGEAPDARELEPPASKATRTQL